MSTHHKMGGSSVIQVYQRAHIGEYRVAIEILFNGYVVSEYNSQGLKTEYKFMVDVKGEEITLNGRTMLHNLIVSILTQYLLLYQGYL